MQTFIDIFQKHSNTNVKIKIESTNPSAFAPYFSYISDASGKGHTQVLCEYLYKKENQSSDPDHNTRNFYLFLFLSSLIYDATQPNPQHQPFCRDSLYIYSDINNSINVIVKSKFKHLKYLTNNIFIQESIKEKILDIFEKTQKTYHGFSKLAKLHKLKKYKSNTKINTDLYLNPIDQKNKNSILINQENNGYWFSISDLMNHIETSLINSPYFFSEPLHPKNPYNNIPFSKTTLYNIYFHVAEIRRQFIPPLFHNFFLCDFDLERFRIENEYLIRDKYIKKHAINVDEERLLLDVRTMIRHVFCNRIIIHDDFPKDKLAQIMRPYYYLFLVYRYHISGIEKKSIAKKALIKKLRELHRYNPNFGKMILKPKSAQLSTMYATTNHRKHLERVFESDHPKFTMKHAIQLCSGTPIKLNYQMPPQRIPQETLTPQRRQPRTPQRTSQRTPQRTPQITLQRPIVSMNQILDSNRNNFSTSFIFSGTRIYTQDQIMTPSDTESDTESESDSDSVDDDDSDILITVNQNERNIIIDNSQNQIEISEELIRHSIEQLLADDEFLNEFEELQREDYDSES
jgi:hypothetical protein